MLAIYESRGRRRPIWRRLPDPDTELPQFFSERRIAVLESFDVRREISTFMLKASARLLHADLQGAAMALEAVTKIEPHLNAAHFVLATIYDVLGDADRSIERYNADSHDSANDVRSLNNLAYALAVSKKRLNDALPYAKKAYDIAHDNKATLTLDLGYAVAARKGTPPTSCRSRPSVQHRRHQGTDRRYARVDLSPPW